MLKYIKKHLIRNKTKSLLFVIIILLSIIMFDRYIYTIVSNEEKIAYIYETVPVYLQFNDKAGGALNSIPFVLVDKIVETGYVDSEKLECGSFGMFFDLTGREKKTGHEVYIYGISEVDMIDNEVVFLDGYSNENFLAGEPVCIVGEDFFDRKRKTTYVVYELGDSIKLCGYWYDAFELSDMKLKDDVYGIEAKIIGYYKCGPLVNEENPIYAPIKYIRSNYSRFFANKYDKSILANIQTYSYANIKLKNLDKLDAFKNELIRNNIYYGNVTNYLRKDMDDLMLVISDKKVNDLVNPLKLNNIILGKFLPLIFTVICVIGFFISYLNSKTIQQEIAIMRMLGMKKVAVIITFFIESIVLTIIGCLLGIGVIYMLGRLNIESFKYFAGFSIFFVLGTLVSISIIGNYKPLNIFRNDN